ncbi:MAG: tRNA/rRNA methyltransferase [Bacteroidota bacterium]|nr:tRNA/rRNA methyltransferase [Bacteroidota bacterium]
MEIHFILIEPAVPENIGASARAINTMGFKSLRLVNPVNFPNEKANWLAHGSMDILEKTKLFKNLEEASHDLDFIIGTSAKKRSVKYDYYPASKLKEIIQNKGSAIQNLGIVFGREESGLTNSELGSCDLVSYIPLASPYPSLNLSQAVMLFAYHLSQLDESLKFHNPNTRTPSYSILKTRIEEILQSIGMDPTGAKYNRIFERLSIVGEKDIKLLHSIAIELIKRLD